MLCRGCGLALKPGDVFCDLGMQPLANQLLSADELAHAQVFYPLRPLVCWNCSLVQLPHCPAPDEIFTDSYPFYAGQSASWLDHCRELASHCLESFHLEPSSRVLDIGSNDGSLIKAFRYLGVPALGVEPCAEVAQHAVMAGAPTLHDWWGTETAIKLLSTRGGRTGQDWKMDLVTCTNVLAHVPNLSDFLVGVRLILAPAGVAVFEIPYLGDLVSDTQYEQIYAEHHSYFSLGSIRRALQQGGLQMASADFLPDIHGGSMRVVASLGNQPDSWGDLSTKLQTEREAGYCDLGKLTSFAERPSQIKRLAWSRLSAHQGSKMVGYGASAKATVALNYLGLDPGVLGFVADTTPVKIGKYIPGCRIPIGSEEQLQATEPDVVINFCYNWRKESEARIRRLAPRARIIYLRQTSQELAAAA